MPRPGVGQLECRSGKACFSHSSFLSPSVVTISIHTPMQHHTRRCHRHRSSLSLSASSFGSISRRNRFRYLIPVLGVTPGFRARLRGPADLTEGSGKPHPSRRSRRQANETNSPWALASSRRIRRSLSCPVRQHRQPWSLGIERRTSDTGTRLTNRRLLVPVSDTGIRRGSVR